MKDCLNCEDEGQECYECWYLGDSPEAKKVRREAVDREYERVFGKNV